jgi:4-amino-4-deoxy-L-arabinose transferase-like glycosyltransferase
LKNNISIDNFAASLIIFFISLFSRSIIAYFYSDKVLVNEWLILVENLYYHNSLSLIRFGDLFLPNLWMPPLYAYYIYLHSLLLGIGEDLVKSVIISQVVISSFTSVIFFKILKNLFEYNLAIIGSIIFCIFPLIVYSSCQISSITIYLFLSILYFHIIIKIISKKRFNCFILGIISGLLILTSRDFILVYIFTLIFILGFRFLNIRNIFIILTITSITISPYLIRNYIAFDRLIIHSGLGYNLWKAYNPEAKIEGFQNSNPKGEEQKYTDESDQLKSKLIEVKKDKFYRLNEDKIYLDQALIYIYEDPVKYFKLFFKRLFSFYFIDLNSSQKNYYNFFHIVPNLIVSIFSIFGFILYKKNNFRLNYLIFITFILVFVYACFAILPRYKLYILPMQIIFSLCFIQNFYSSLIKKN